jgi:hypothetical protein
MRLAPGWYEGRMVLAAIAVAWLPLVVTLVEPGSASATPPVIVDAVSHPDLILAGAAAIDAMRHAERASNDAATISEVLEGIIDRSAHPLVTAAARRARVGESIRALRVGDAAAELDEMGAPRELSCRTPWAIGERDDDAVARDFDARLMAGQNDPPPTAAPALVPVIRSARGGFDLDEPFIETTRVRVRCAIAARRDTARPTALRLGATGPVKAWHGSERRLVIADDAERSPGSDQVAGLVQLGPRWTLLVVELTLLDRGGFVDLRLTEADGAAVKGLRWSTNAADILEASRRHAGQLPAKTPRLRTWAVDPSRFPEPGYARAAARVLDATGAFDRRTQPDLLVQARAAQLTHAQSPRDRVDALVALAMADVRRDPSLAAARLTEALHLDGINDDDRVAIFASWAALHDAQGDTVAASAAWAEVRRLAPHRHDTTVAALSFERRRGVLGLVVDREILALATRSQYRPLLLLAADVLEERGDVAGALEVSRRAGDRIAAVLREAHIAEARLAIDPAAKAALLAAWRDWLSVAPSSHATAEAMALLALEQEGASTSTTNAVSDSMRAWRTSFDVDAFVGERLRRFPARTEPLRLASKVALLRGDRARALSALVAAQTRTPDDGDLQRAIRALREEHVDELTARVPAFVPALIAAARQSPPPDAGAGAYFHHKVIATRFFDNGNLARIDDLVVVVMDARRAADLRAISFGYSGGRERLDVLAAERVSLDGHREAPEQVLDRGQSGKENGAYSDVRSKTVLFSNVNDGDVLHIRIRRETTGLQNQFGDFFGDIEMLEGTLPVRRFEMTIEGPTDRPLSWGGRGAPAPEVVTAGETTTYRFVATDLPALVGETSMPPWMEVARSISVSTYSDAASLGSWYEALIADQLRLDDTLRAVVERERSAATDTRDLVRRLYEHVVTTTRYVGIELGIHGWKPYPVAEVYRRRFGDCKDKASLLVALLRHAGIEAHLALVRTMHLGHTSTTPPSMWTFNHAIAWVAPFDLFLDGTAERSGMLELPESDQGAAALIVDGNKSRLVTIPVAPASANDNTSNYLLHIQPDGALVVEGQESFRGTRAARERARFEDASTQRLTLERELAQGIPGAQVTGIEVGDLALRQETVSYQFQALLPRRADVSVDGVLVLPISLYPHDLAGNYAATSSRRYEVFLDHPWRTRNVMRYVLPPGYELEAVPEGGSITSPHLSFTQRITRTTDGFVVDEDTAITSRRIPQADYAVFRSAAIAADALMKKRLRIVPAGARR